MKAGIAIKESNKDKIEALLKDVNHEATAHTFTTYKEIEDLTVQAERELERLLFKKDWPKAEWYAVSGGKVARSYKFKRIATGIRMARRNKDWVLTHVYSYSLFPDRSGYTTLYLTPEQDVAAKQKLATTYSIQILGGLA